MGQYCPCGSDTFEQIKVERNLYRVTPTEGRYWDEDAHIDYLDSEPEGHSDYADCSMCGETLTAGDLVDPCEGCGYVGENCECSRCDYCEEVIADCGCCDCECSACAGERELTEAKPVWEAVLDQVESIKRVST